VPHLIEGGVLILQYADDTILLIQDDMEQIIYPKLILYMFEAMSHLKINFPKSEVMMVLQDEEKNRCIMIFLAVKWEIGLSNI
jgi:hypothetical protein